MSNLTRQVRFKVIFPKIDTYGAVKNRTYQRSASVLKDRDMLP